MASGSGSGHLYALDFDGVLCDSCGESSLSALKAAKIRWPFVFSEVDPATEDWITDQMHTLRPVVETGYENLLLVRLLVELKIPSVRTSSVAEGLSVETILDNWLKLKPTVMSEWNEDKDFLVDLFGRVRDEWMGNDLSSWMGANRNCTGGYYANHDFKGVRFYEDIFINSNTIFYPGVADALRFSSSEVYIVTTKQSRFAEALLRELAGINFPSEKIYGLGTGPKVEVLKKLQAMPQHTGMTLHFVEDRLATLKNVIKEPALNQWNLYLGTWGYNTEKERNEAQQILRIQLVDISEFSKNLK